MQVLLALQKPKSSTHQRLDLVSIFFSSHKIMLTTLTQDVWFRNAFIGPHCNGRNQGWLCRARLTRESGRKDVGELGLESINIRIIARFSFTSLLTSECWPAPMWTPTKPGLAEPCSMLVAVVLREVAGSSTTGPPPYWAAAAGAEGDRQPGPLAAGCVEPCRASRQTAHTHDG